MGDAEGSQRVARRSMLVSVPMPGFSGFSIQQRVDNRPELLLRNWTEEIYKYL